MDALDTPIFHRAYDVYKALHSWRNGIPKQDRHGLWQRIEDVSLNVIENLFAAGQANGIGKREQMEQASIALNMLRLLLRLAKDTRVIDLKKYASAQQDIDEIGRMLGGWMKSVKAATPPPRRIFEMIERRRKCRTDDAHRLPLRLSSQLLLTFTRPSLTLSSARLSASVR